MPFDHPAEIALLAFFFGLVAKWIWDQFRRNNPMKLEDCATIRKMCSTERLREADLIEGKIADKVRCQDGRLGDGDREFQKLHEKVTRIEKLLAVILQTQLQLCKSAKLDCDDITRSMVKMGLEP
jgi:hypothetical protein